MGDFLTFDVVDRPSQGAVRRLRALGRMPLPEGCRGLVPGATGEFPLVMSDIPYTRGRIGVLTAWDSEDAADASSLSADLATGARGHWHVRGPLGYATHDTPWRGWEPEPESNRPVPKDQPVLVFISGELQLRHLRPFLRGSTQAARQAAANPGYLAGLTFFSSPRNTTSVSAWRTAGHSRAFAFKGGAHATAMAKDLAEGHHVTQRFLRMRPVRTSGSLGAANPFAGIVPES